MSNNINNNFMQKEGTTNKTMILIGLLVIAAISIAMILVANKSENNNKRQAEFSPIEGAVAGSFGTPEALRGTRDYDTPMGSNKAKLNVLVYEDYSNSYSAKLAQTLDQLSSEYKNDIAIISRPFVAPNSPDSHMLSVTYLCAKDAGKGDEMRNLLLSQVDKDLLLLDPLSYAQALKLNEDKFRACLASEKTIATIDELKKDAKDNMVLGSPTILIEDEMIIGARPYSDFVDSNGDAIEGLKTVVERHLSKIE